MTSLGAQLPPPGSVAWKGEGAAASGKDDAFYNELRVRHAVIRETSSQPKPKPHVVYKLDVMTQSDQWSVYRRFSEFLHLQQQMMKLHTMQRDMLPGKRYTGNLSAGVIEKRREALERYIQRLVNSDKEVVFSEPLLEFLDVHRHDVVGVTTKMAQHLHKYGEEILSKTLPFHMTPTQCRCIGKRLKLPINYASLVEEQARRIVGTPSDPAHLYDFVYQLGHLCLHPRKKEGLPAPEQPVDSVSADLSIFRSLQYLEIEHTVVKLLKGFGALQPHIKLLRCNHTGVLNLKDILSDAVAEKTSAPKNISRGVAPWRQQALGKLVESRVRVNPWRALETIDFSHNELSSLDCDSLNLCPAIERVLCPYNCIASLDGWLSEGHTQNNLRKLDLSHNLISSLSVQPTSTPSSVGERTPPLSPTRQQPFAISPGWSRSGSIPPSLSTSLQTKSRAGSVDTLQAAPSPDPLEGSPVSQAESSATETAPTTADRPHPSNTLPPSYSAPHLITTHHPNASLDELQRLRAERLAAETPTGEAGPTASPTAKTPSSLASALAAQPSASALELCIDDSDQEIRGFMVMDAPTEEEVAPSGSSGPEEEEEEGNGNRFLESPGTAEEESDAVLRSAAREVVAAAAGGLEKLLAREELSSSAGSTPALSPHPSPPPPSRVMRQRSKAFDLSPEEGLVMSHMTNTLATVAPFLTELHLAGNQLQTLKGLERLLHLEYLDVSANRIAQLRALAPLVNLSSLNQLLLVGNPVCKAVKGWRLTVLAKCTAHPSQLIIDGQECTERELSRVRQMQQSNVKGRRPR